MQLIISVSKVTSRLKTWQTAPPSSFYSLYTTVSHCTDVEPLLLSFWCFHALQTPFPLTVCSLAVIKLQYGPQHCTQALHSQQRSSAFSQTSRSHDTPPKKICFCGINLPLELVLWSRTQNLGELHKYAQKAERVAELWGGKDSTVDPRWQLEIWLTLETHGNNGGWSALKKKKRKKKHELKLWVHLLM